MNQELDGLDGLLTSLVGRLCEGARLVVISFHSLEDRIAKHTFRGLAQNQFGRVLTKRPIVAGEAELQRNPRARSAKLRALERVA